MKKKNIILASILGASALAAGVTGVILADSNNQNNIALEESLSFNESNLAEDDIFAQGFSSEKFEYPVLMTENETSEIGTKTLDASRRNGTDKPVQCC